jgi:hypothetical protein
MNDKTPCLSNMEKNDQQHGGQDLPAPICSPFFDLAIKWGARAIVLGHLAEKNNCIMTDAEAQIFRRFSEELRELANEVQMRLDSPPDPIRQPCGGCGEFDPHKRCVGCFHDFSATTERGEG